MILKTYYFISIIFPDNQTLQSWYNTYTGFSCRYILYEIFSYNTFNKAWNVI